MEPVTHLLAVVPMLGPDWLDAEKLITQFGPGPALVVVCAIVFIETGLLFPFLPGDSLLFTAGLLVATQYIQTPLWVLCLAIFAAAFLGDQTGYAIGRFAGPKIFRREDSRIFKQAYVDQTYAFFDKYGGRAIILGRFVPIVRTFIPVAAGVGHMRYRTFVSYNVIGALAWGVGVTLLGYFLGQVAFVRDNIEPILIVIVALSLVPVAVELVRARLGKGPERDERYDEESEREAVARRNIES